MEKTNYIGASPLQNREERKESRWTCSRMVSNALHLMLCRWVSFDPHTVARVLDDMLAVLRIEATTCSL